MCNSCEQLVASVCLSVCVGRYDDSDEVMSQRKAEDLLMSELQYDKERAQFIVRQFDRNGDGKLSAKELERFKDSVKQT